MRENGIYESAINAGFACKSGARVVYNRRMNNSHLVAAIDAEIDRLQRARDLLSQLSVAEIQSSEQAVAVPAKKRGRPRKVQVVAEAHPEPILPTIQRLPYVEKRTRSRRSKASLEPSTALRHATPTMPVFVSAAEAEKARVRESERTVAAKPVQEPIEQDSGRSLGALIRALSPNQIPAGFVL
jgi:hypothetical protein